MQGMSVPFGYGPMQDPDDSSSMIVGSTRVAWVFRTATITRRTMPSRRRPASATCSTCRRVFELLGDSPEVAKKNAATVMRMETSLANASLTRVERRDPYKQKHKMTVPELYKIAPDFDWKAFFSASGVPKFEILNVYVARLLEGCELADQVGFGAGLADLPALACGPFAGAVFFRRHL